MTDQPDYPDPQIAELIKRSEELLRKSQSIQLQCAIAERQLSELLARSIRERPRPEPEDG
jgi:hypothetical protein